MTPSPFTAFGYAILLVATLTGPQACIAGEYEPDKRPNILIAISDDHSWPHTSIQGSPFVETPNLDAIANSGFHFLNGYAASPGCSPSRASLLTGQHHWMNGPAGTHGSSFPVQLVTFVDILENAGYKSGFTGKGWGPGDWLAGGRDKNPAGVEFNEQLFEEKPPKGISNKDYTANFKQFLSEREEGQPFVFWYGAHEPHLKYEEGPRTDEELATVVVPEFLQDTPTSRATLLDYADEIHHFDVHLGNIITLLEESGELDNTLVIVTADNGMPMQLAKATGYDYGSHVPMAIRFGPAAEQRTDISAPVGFVDLSATIIDAAGLDIPENFVGTSLIDLLQGDADSLPGDRAVYAGRERHSSSRYQNESFPQRIMRRGEYLLIWSPKPEREPAGQHQEIIDGELAEPYSAYYEIGPSAIKRELLTRRNDPDIKPFFERAVRKRPEWELCHVVSDPACLTNLADAPELAELVEDYKKQLLETLRETGDPRVLGYGHIWEFYPRTQGTMRYFPNPYKLEQE